MPVQKEKKYEITIKNLRHREIPCLVIAVPQKSEVSTHSETHFDFKSQDTSNNKILKHRKQKLNRISKIPSRKFKSLSCLDGKNDLTSRGTKKRIYRKRSLQTEISSLKETPDILCTTSDVNKNTPVSPVETLKRRTYHKKKLQVSMIKKNSGSSTSASTVQLCFGTPVIAPETPKKRVYRKKLKIPAVPHNNPALCSGSDGDSITSTSFLSQSTAEHSQVVTIIKRGRGRPRLSFPAVRLSSDNGEESTMSQGSDKSSVTRRARKSLWSFDSDEDDEAEANISEYELLRQRNIEENLKKLREIFTQKGLEFEEKTSETPKKRKSYSRLPLPPPRPRSQRLEIRRTFMPLDFSKLDEKLTMSEAVFM